MTDDELRELLAEEFAKADCPMAAARIRQSKDFVIYPTDLGAVRAMRRAYDAGRNARPT